MRMSMCDVSVFACTTCTMIPTICELMLWDAVIPSLTMPYHALLYSLLSCLESNRIESCWCVVSCSVVFFSVLSCSVVFFSVLFCSSVSCSVVLCSVLFCFVKGRVERLQMSCHALPCLASSIAVVQYRTILFCTTPCFTLLCSFVFNSCLYNLFLMQPNSNWIDLTWLDLTWLEPTNPTRLNLI